MPKNEASDTIPSLDGWRAVSILIVLVSHAGFGHVVPGGLGVTIFFFLSGHLITTLLLREYTTNGEISIPKFYLRRAFRLYPPLLVTLAVAYALVGAGILGGGITWAGVASQLLYFANYHLIFLATENSIPSGTGILWSLAIEEHFYLVYPAVLGLLLDRGVRPHRIAIVLSMVCIAVLLWRYHLVGLPGFKPDRTYYATDTRIDSIIYGCILALLRFRREDASAGNRASIDPWAYFFIFMAGAGLLASIAIRNEVFRETLRYTVQGIALLPLFHYSMEYPIRFPFAVLNLNAVRYVGVLSYSVYLIHQVVISLIDMLPPALSGRKWLVVTITFALSILYASALDRFVEPKFRALRKAYRA